MALWNANGGSAGRYLRYEHSIARHKRKHAALIHVFLLFCSIFPRCRYICVILSRPSQRVLELGILLIRHVEELLVLNLGIRRIRPNQALLEILSPVVPPDEGKINEASAPADQDGDFGRPVLWCIFRTKRLWPWKRSQQGWSAGRLMRAYR